MIVSLLLVYLIIGLAVAIPVAADEAITIQGYIGLVMLFALTWPFIVFGRTS